LLYTIYLLFRPIPVNSNPNEIKNTIISKANNGKAMGSPDIAIVIIPSTILPMRDPLDPPEEVIPIVILSIPKNIKAIENRPGLVTKFAKEKSHYSHYLSLLYQAESFAVLRIIVIIQRIN
jgi:hypothetical protein